MEVVNLGRLRRFLGARPMRVGVFDRPRLVGDLLCLEPDQQEARPTQSAADELYLVVEGRAHLRAGLQAWEMEALDAVVVPPGVERSLFNPGPGRLTALVVLAPKPTRVVAPAGRPPLRPRPGAGPEREEAWRPRLPGRQAGRPPPRAEGRPDVAGSPRRGVGPEGGERPPQRRPRPAAGPERGEPWRPPRPGGAGRPEAAGERPPARRGARPAGGGPSRPRRPAGPGGEEGRAGGGRPRGGQPGPGRPRPPAPGVRKDRSGRRGPGRSGPRPSRPR